MAYNIDAILEFLGSTLLDANLSAIKGNNIVQGDYTHVGSILQLLSDLSVLINEHQEGASASGITENSKQGDLVEEEGKEREELEGASGGIRYKMNVSDPGHPQTNFGYLEEELLRRYI